MRFRHYGELRIIQVIIRRFYELHHATQARENDYYSDNCQGKQKQKVLQRLQEFVYKKRSLLPINLKIVTLLQPVKTDRQKIKSRDIVVHQSILRQNAFK